MLVLNSKFPPDRVFKSVLFDLDNTLVDTEPLLRRALSSSGCKPEISDDDLRNISPVKLLPTLAGSDGEEKFWHHYHRLATVNSRLMDSSTPHVLQLLFEAGISLGIVTTNVLSIVTVALQRCGILKYFEGCIVSYETCSRRKPHPEPLIRALELLEQQPKNTLYVGDSERDALASRDSGVHFGLAGWVPGVDRHLAMITPTTILETVHDLLAVTGVEDREVETETLTK